MYFSDLWSLEEKIDEFNHDSQSSFVDFSGFISQPQFHFLTYFITTVVLTAVAYYLFFTPYSQTALLFLQQMAQQGFLLTTLCRGVIQTHVELHQTAEGRWNG